MPVDDLLLAHRIVEVATPVALSQFARGIGVGTKADGSLVTEAVKWRIIIELLACRKAR